MKKLLAGMKCAFSASLFAGLMIASGCDDEESKIDVSFETTAATIEEGDDVSVVIALSKPLGKSAFVTLSVNSPTAEFAQDFGIDNLLFLSGKFTVQIAAGATTGSFTLKALGDFEMEAAEIVTFEIAEVSDGLSPKDPSVATVTINNMEDYPEDNRALSFDGIDDFVDLGNIYDDLAFPVTVSAWIWLDPNAPDGIIPIFNSQDGKAEYSGLNFMTSNVSVGAIQFGDGTGGNNPAYRRAKSATFLPIMGRWINLTGIIRGTNDMDIFLNGVNVDGSYSGSSALPMNSNSPTEKAKIGYYFLNGVVYHYKGKIDELRIWNRSLPEAEIQTVIFKKIDATYPGLIGYWNFDEPKGDVLIDQSSKKYNGTVLGNPGRVLSEVPVR